MKRRTEKQLRADIALAAERHNTYAELAAAAHRTMEKAQCELAELATAPMWVKLSGEPVPVASMDENHLINALRVCVRMDRRYAPWNPARMRAYAQLVREAWVRGIPTEDWIMEGE